MYGLSDQHLFDVEIKRLQRDAGSDKSPKPMLGIIPPPVAELQCFNRANRKRTLTAICAASAQQVIGASFVIGNATYFFALIGVHEYFNASVALYVVMLASSAAAFPLSEIVGRRALIVPSQFALCLLLLLIGIVGYVPNQERGGWAILVLIYLWAVIYQVSIGATGFVLASEVATLRLRAATQALVTMSNGVWGLIMQFTIPYMVSVLSSTNLHRRRQQTDHGPDQPRCWKSRRQDRLHLLRAGSRRVHPGLVAVPRDQGCSLREAR